MALKKSTILKRQREYKRKLAELEKTGLYLPKGKELTRYRKTQINKRYRQYSGILESDDYFFIKPKGKAKKPVLKQAKELNMQTTQTGIFMEKLGAKRATVRKSKRKGEYEIRLTGKVKRGKRRGKKYETLIPLAPLDSIVDEKFRLRSMANSFGELKKNERLAFKIVEGGQENFSKSVFQNIQSLLKYLEKYRKTDAERIKFFRHVVIEKTTITGWLDAKEQAERCRVCQLTFSQAKATRFKNCKRGCPNPESPKFKD